MRKKMIVALTGGLGNQMFQYAFGQVLRNKYGTEIEYDTNFYKKYPEWKVQLNNYNVGSIKCTEHPVYGKVRLYVQRIPLIRWLIGTYKEHDEFVIDNNIFRRKYRFYAGYWQNYRYFESIKEQLKLDLKYSGVINATINATAEDMKNSNSIAVHVRRGDYLTGKFKEVFASLDEDYYRRAITLACSKLDKKSVSDEKIQIYFFSNDIEWCKQTFGDISNAIFVDNSISESEHTDLYLMQCAKILIMANSTFSWWAAWFSSMNGNEIIAPANWFIDEKKNEKAKKALILDLWIVI